MIEHLRLCHHSRHMKRLALLTLFVVATPAVMNNTAVADPPSERDPDEPPRWYEQYPEAMNDIVVTAEIAPGNYVAAAAFGLRQLEYVSLSGQPEVIPAYEFVSDEIKFQTIEQLFGPDVRVSLNSPDLLNKIFLSTLKTVHRAGTRTVLFRGWEGTITVDAFGRINGKTLKSDPEMRIKTRIVNLTRRDREEQLVQVGVSPGWLGQQTDLAVLRLFHQVETLRQLGPIGVHGWELPSITLGGCGENSCDTTTYAAAVRFTTRTDRAIAGANGVFARPTHELALKLIGEAENKNWPGGTPEARMAGLTDPDAISRAQMATVNVDIKDQALLEFGAPAAWLTMATVDEKTDVLVRLRRATTMPGQQALHVDYTYYVSEGSGDSVQSVPVNYVFDLTFAVDAAKKVNGKTPLIESAITTQTTMEWMSMAAKRNLLTQAGFPFSATRIMTPAEAADVTTRIAIKGKINGDHKFDFTAAGGRWMGAVKVVDGRLLGGGAAKYPPDPKWYEELLGPVMAMLSIAFPPFAPYAAVVNAAVAIDNGATGIRLFASIAAAAAGISEIVDVSSAGGQISQTTTTLRNVSSVLNTASTLHSAIQSKDALGIFASVVGLADSIGSMVGIEMNGKFDIVRLAARAAGIVSAVRNNPMGLAMNMFGALVNNHRAAAEAPGRVLRNRGPVTVVNPADELEVAFAQVADAAIIAEMPVFVFDKGDGQGAQIYPTVETLEDVATLARASQYAARSTYQGGELSAALDAFGGASAELPETQIALFNTLAAEVDRISVANAARSNSMLNGVDQSTVAVDPLSRLGAYAATRGFAAGTLGYALHNAIAEDYLRYGELGAEKMGEFYGSAQAMAFYALPADSASADDLALIERDFWLEKLPTFGGLVGTALAADDRADQFAELAVEGPPALRDLTVAPYTPPPPSVNPGPYPGEDNPRCPGCPAP